jgi:sortase A
MRARKKRILVWSQSILAIAAFCLLGYCVVMLATARYFQAQAREKLLKSSSEPAVRPAPSQTPGTSRQGPSPVGRDSSLVGLVAIPRIRLSAVIAEGANSHVLRVAVGHVPGTALPWQTGNTALVAHRDTFFRRLGELQTGDVIQIKVSGTEYVYRVSFTEVVKPNETWVLQRATGDTLTLITCYPFHFVGPAPERFVVRARRLRLWPVTETGRTGSIEAAENAGAWQ